MIVLLLGLLGCPHRADVDTTGTELRSVDAEVRAVLEAGAGSLDPLERRPALAALVRLDPAPGGGSWALRGRYDPSTYVQRAVVESLGGRPEPEATVVLEGLARDVAAEPYTRGLAALELARRDAARWAGPLAELAAAERHSPELLLTAAAVAGDAASLARLQRRLAEGELPMDLALPRALARSGLPIGPALAAAVEAVEPPMAPAMAGAWLGVDPAAARPWFVGALAGEDEDQAIEAAEWLVELGVSAPGPAVSPIARGLLSLPSASLAEATRAAADPDPDIRAAAARRLGVLLRDEPRGGAAREALERLATTPNARVQPVAIDALGVAGGSDAVLRLLLRDESTRVRVNAACATLR